MTRVRQRISARRLSPPACARCHRRACRVIVDSRLFSGFIVLCILGNTVVLAVERHNMPDSERELLDKCNIVFTLIFFLEMLLKHIGWRCCS